MVQKSSWLRAILCGGLICAGIFLLSGNHPDRVVNYQRSVETSEYFFYLEITNRTFNNSLLDPTSDYYKSLKSEIEALMNSVYKFCSCATRDTYDGATDMSFSNGSLVIAKMTLVFHTVAINPYVVKYLFVNSIIANPSEDLHINIEYTRDVQTPVIATTTQAPPTTPMPTQTPVVNSTTVTTADPVTSQSAVTQRSNQSVSTSRGPTSSPEPVTQDPNNGNWTSTVSANTGPSISNSSVTPWSNDTRGGSSTSNSGSVTSSSSHDATKSSGFSNSSTSQASHHTTKGSNISNSPTTSSPTHSATTSSPTHSATTSSPTHSATTSSPTHSATTSSPTHSATTSSPTHSATTSSPTHSPTTSSPTHSATTSSPTHSATTSSPTHSATSSATNNTEATPSHPPSNASSLPPATPAGHPMTGAGASTTAQDTTDHSGSRKSTPQSGNQGRTTTGNGSGSSNPRPYWLDWVPGWGIALLVLAALILLLLIILLIMLLVRWCCMKGEKRPLPVSDPYQHTTPSPAPTYVSHSPAPVNKDMSDDHPDKPKRNKTGMYVVNP